MLFVVQRVTPSASVMWNLTNVLSSYVITIRVYNGEHESYIQEAANMLIALSANLSTNQNFEDFNMAVTAARQEAINVSIVTKLSRWSKSFYIVSELYTFLKHRA